MQRVLTELEEENIVVREKRSSRDEAPAPGAGIGDWTGTGDGSGSESGIGTGTGDRAGAEVLVCDAENMERLLRMERRRRRESLNVHKTSTLPLLFSRLQNVSGPAVDEESDPGLTAETLEPLVGYPADPRLWEREILPARLPHYRPAVLDSLLREGELIWAGGGERAVYFCYPEDLELLQNPAEEESTTILPDTAGKYSFRDIKDQCDLPTPELDRELWREAWEGRISSDSFAPLREAARRDFAPLEEPGKEAPVGGEVRRKRSGRRRRSSTGRFGGGRAGYRRWRSSPAFSGNWFRLSTVAGREEELDSLDMLERDKERARLILDRYGVVFRRLIRRELPVLEWRRIFNALRIMELSGEVTGGHFIEGIEGIQFISRQAVSLLGHSEAEKEDRTAGERIIMLNACDPASPCGLGLDIWQGKMPARIASTHIVFRDLFPESELLLVSRRWGTELEFMRPAEDPLSSRALLPLRRFFHRSVDPVTSIRVERVNGEAVKDSPYRVVLEELGFTSDYRGMRLHG
jgi:ATP-dependent Lhr-like helicase